MQSDAAKDPSVEIRTRLQPRAMEELIIVLRHLALDVEDIRAMLSDVVHEGGSESGEYKQRHANTLEKARRVFGETQELLARLREAVP
jgi:hypothetical protein